MKGSKLQRFGLALLLLGVLSTSARFYGPDYSLAAYFGVVLTFVGLFVSDDGVADSDASDDGGSDGRTDDEADDDSAVGGPADDADRYRQSPRVWQ